MRGAVNFYTTLLCAALLTLAAAVVLPSAAHAGVKAVIDKSEQTMRVWEGDKLLYIWPASTGKLSAYTPTGTFHPTRFYPGRHTSGKYGGSMIDSVYYKGIRAIHGVDEPEHLAALGKYGTSNGCTHLSPEHARIFYRLASKYKHSQVTIVIQP